MKTICTVVFCVLAIFTFAQGESGGRVSSKYGMVYDREPDITATPTRIDIRTRVIYNAMPDGYHVTWTTSYIGRTVDEVENRMNERTDSLVGLALNDKLIEKDVLVDVIELIPVFEFTAEPTEQPIGFKIIQNITFHLKDISRFRDLYTLCLKFGIYDLIGAEAYINQTKHIRDSLDRKSIELLNVKKDLCAKAGWSISGGKTSLDHYRDVFYPSERYLKSYLSAETMFRHHIAESSTLTLKRTVDIDDAFNLNLKDADCVFNEKATTPVIQFLHVLDYSYEKVDTEQEMRDKIRKEETAKPKKEFFIIDDDGNLKRIHG